MGYFDADLTLYSVHGAWRGGVEFRQRTLACVFVGIGFGLHIWLVAAINH